jgi:hypothetical protein
MGGEPDRNQPPKQIAANLRNAQNSTGPCRPLFIRAGSPYLIALPVIHLLVPQMLLVSKMSQGEIGS